MVKVSFKFSRLIQRARQMAAEPGVIWRYTIALAAVFAATGLRLAFKLVLGLEAPHVAFAFAVILAAWFGGRGPGLVATALSALSLDWYFLEPIHSLAIAHSQDIWELSLFAASSAIISLLVGRLRESVLARARTEQELRQLVQLIDFSHDAIITMDSERRIIRWNKGAEEMYGWPEQDAVGHVLSQLLQTVSPISCPEIDEILRREGRWEGELSQIARDDRRLFVHSRQALIRGRDGLPDRIIGIFVEITERKQNEERLRQAQKLESIGLLAGGIAHDFNNLLTVIIGNADLVLHKYPSIDEIQHIISASERAAELTSQLLAYAGMGHFVTTTFNLSDLVSGSRQLVSASIPKTAELVFHLSEEELPIEADPSQIEQVLMNLVINAGEAMPPHTDGRIEIATSICDVALEAVRAHAPAFDARPGQFVCLEVADNGAGMDEATLARIFDPFFSTKFTGRGLGLAAVQGIVRSCGGFIEVQSSSGVGSKFRVFLPAAGRKPAAVIPASGRPGALRRRDLRHAAILVVDDEEMVRQLACVALQRQGYEVLEAKDGKDAIGVLARAGPLPSLVLLDLTMPRIGGEELVPILNRDYPGLNIIVTSGYAEENVRPVFPPGAVAGFLQKPYTAAALTEKVEKTLDSGGPNNEAPAAA